MKMAPLRGTDWKLSAIGLGMADIGVGIGVPQAERMLDAYLDMGGNLLDTARVYSDWVPGEMGRGERLLGEWIRRRGGTRGFYLATKGAHPRLNSMHTPRMSPAEITGDVDLSLRALGVEAIDLYYLHRDDRGRAVEEILDTLEGCVKTGKIRAYACSNWQADRMEEAHACAARRGWQGFAANQVFWSMGSHNSRGLADDTCVACDPALRQAFERTGITAVAYTSQANGFFTKLAQGDPRAAQGGRAIYDTAGNRRVYEAARAVCEQTGRTMTEVALSYLTSQPHPTIAVVGCKSEAQLHESMAAAQSDLSAQALAALERAIYA